MLCQDYYKGDLKQLVPKSASDVMGICIWNNTNIKINHSPVFYRRWYNKNIQYIKGLIDENGLLLTYEQFQKKYNLRTNFTEYMGIRTSIETYIRLNQIHLGTESLFNYHRPFNVKLKMKSHKGSQDIYTALTCKILVPTSQ